ncbi:MAG TPA: energy transducer TonB [Thermoanaerobaculia bacterium]|nr:energy transducer TonB [Thermoanaerobaculia bacterium]
MSILFRIRPAVAAAVLASVFAGSAAAPPLTRRQFSQRLEETGRWAHEGRWEKVGRAADRLVHELVTLLVSEGEIGDETSQAAATVLSLQALAASAEGRRDDALWSWSLAQSLWPDLARATLSSYGEPAALLRDNHLTPEDFAACREEDDEGTAQAIEEAEEEGPAEVIEPPVKLAAPEPEYPFGARTAHTEGSVVVRVIVDADGSVHTPVLARYPSVALALAAAEPLRRWRFEPARRDGEPVASYYCLQVNFELTR